MIATKHLGLRLPKELHQRLEDIARAENNKVSAVCRRLLTLAVSSERPRSIARSRQ